MTRRLANIQSQNSKGKAYIYAFSISTSQVLHSHTLESECIVDSDCTHHIAKGATLFSSLKEAIEKRSICSR